MLIAFRSLDDGEEKGVILENIVPRKKQTIYFLGTSYRVVDVNINYDKDRVTVFVKKTVIDPITKAVWEDLKILEGDAKEAKEAYRSGEMVRFYGCPFCGGTNITQYSESEEYSHCPDCGRKVRLSLDNWEGVKSNAKRK